MSAVLAKMDAWQFDSFELDDASNGWPLSALAFAILKKCDLVPGRCGISEIMLCGYRRWLALTSLLCCPNLFTQIPDQ